MTGPLSLRFREELSALGLAGRSRPLVVAVSGGLDSCVLLHLLRFSAPQIPLVVAHFDHCMRPTSASDAAWVRGVCRAWDVPSVTGVAEVPARSEDDARRARYTYLESVVADRDGYGLCTAHHADDQAETVLFRILRGTGLAGLRGIPAERAPGVYRPLLPFWRKELEAYASAVGLSWREDATNEHLGYPRNAIRHDVLPRAERAVARGAREALVHLAGLAAENERAWAAVLPDLFERIDLVEMEDGGRSFDHAALLTLDSSLRTRVIRNLAEVVGRPLGRQVSGQVVAFAVSGRSGGRVSLGGGMEIRRELDRVVLGPTATTAEERPLVILDPGPGSGEAVVGGRSVHVAWDAGPPLEGTDRASFPVEALDFPLTFRSRDPGDRIRLVGGSRKVKKLLLESRIPLAERERVPVLVDVSGRVLWVSGVARTSEMAVEAGETLRIRIEQ